MGPDLQAGVGRQFTQSRTEHRNKKPILLGVRQELLKNQDSDQGPNAQ